MTHETQEALRQIAISKLIKLPQVILILLSNKQRKGWLVMDIARVLGAKPSAVTMAKQKLLKQRLVYEQHPFRDLRETKIYLTDEGYEEACKFWGLIDSLKTAASHIRSRDADAV